MTAKEQEQPCGQKSSPGDNRLLAGLVFDPDRGELLLSNTRYLLIRPETVMTFQREAEAAFGDVVGRILFQGGCRGGRLSAETFGRGDGRQGEAIALFMADMGTQLGWGRLRISRCSLEDGTLEVEVDNSVFAQGYGTASQPVCHLIGGVFAGVAEVIFQSPVEGMEETCLARGDRRCRFIFRAVGKGHHRADSTGHCTDNSNGHHTANR